MKFCENPKCRNAIEVPTHTQVLKVPESDPMLWTGELDPVLKYKDVRRTRFALHGDSVRMRWLCEWCVTAIFNGGFTP